MRRILVANGDSLLESRGIEQSLHLVQAVILNHDDARLRRCDLDGYGLTTTREEFAAGVGSQFPNHREEFFRISVLVIDGDLRNLKGRRLRLSMQGLNCCSSKRR